MFISTKYSLSRPIRSVYFIYYLFFSFSTSVGGGNTPPPPPPPPSPPPTSRHCIMYQKKLSASNFESSVSAPAEAQFKPFWGFKIFPECFLKTTKFQPEQF